MQWFLRLLRFLAVACAVVIVLGLVKLVYFGPLPRLQPVQRATPAQPGLTPGRAPEAVEDGAKPAPVGEVTAARPSEPPEPLVEGYEQWVIDTLKQNPPVREVEIEQDGHTFRLILVVEGDTPVEEARRLGDGLVRLTKFYVEPDHGPGKFVGPGYYDYVVHVYLGGWQLFEGRKAAGNDRIRWIINRPE